MRFNAKHLKIVFPFGLSTMVCNASLVCMLFSTTLTLEGLTVGFFSCYPKYFKGFKYRLELCPKNYLKSKHILGSAR